MKNKKAMQALNMMLWIPRIFFMVIVISSVLFIVLLFTKVEVSTWQTESEIFAQRTLLSPHGISYYDSLSNRVYPGIIDTGNFEVFSNSIQTKRLAAKIELFDQNNKLINKTYINENTYKNWIVKEGIGGIGGIDVSRKSLYVLVKEDEKLTPATISYTIIIPRS